MAHNLRFMTKIRKMNKRTQTYTYHKCDGWHSAQ